MNLPTGNFLKQKSKSLKTHFLKKITKKKQLEKLKEIEAKVKHTSTTIIDTLNPIQSGISTTEKTIRCIILIYIEIFLYQLIRDFEMIRADRNDIT